MNRMRLRLLGEFELWVGASEQRVVPAGKSQALLAYLALTPGLHPRDKLAALLWPDAAPSLARKQVRQTLFVLRKALAAGPALLAMTADAIALVPDTLETDVAAFERAVAKGSGAALEQAADLYAGDFLTGLRAVAPTFDDWLASERERLRELAVQALDRLFAHRQAAGAGGAALAVATRLLALNPVHERTHRALMRIHLNLGRRDAALRQYAECVEILRRELAVAPEAETRELYEESLRGGTTGPPATLVAVGPSRLPLVGREVELARLHQALTAAWTGRGAHAVAVVGEAGVGKSRLLAALAAEAERRGGAVLLGRSYESEQILPLGPWVSAIREAGVLTRRHVLDGLDIAARAQLARLFPELAASAAAVVDASGDAGQLFEALVELLRGLAHVQPLAIVLEDLHWADDMTLRFLGFLVRRCDAAQILLAVSVREEEVLAHSTLRAVLDELETGQRLTRLVLLPLGRDDALALIQQLATADPRASAAVPRAGQIWESSGGNPFIVTETVRGIADGIRLDVGGSLPLPARVRETIGRRLAGLGDGAKQLLRVAAVIGRDFDFELLRRGAGLDEEPAAESFEELIRRRLLHGVGTRFDFVHERVRDVALTDVFPPRRQLLHAKVAAAMEALPGEDLLRHCAALGMHYRHAAVWDKAVRFFREAGRQAIERCAYREAVALLEQAKAALGFLPESRATLEQAFETRLELRNALLPLGDLPAIVQHLREAETLARRLDDTSREVRVASLLLSRFWASGDHGAAVDEGQRALTMAEALGDLGPLVLIRTRLGEARYLRGDYRAAALLFKQNLAALTGDHALERFGLLQPPAVHSRVWLAWCLGELGMCAEARAVAGDSVTIAQQLGEPVALNFAWAGTGVLALQRGRLPEAIQALERAVDVWPGDTPPWLSRYTGALGLAYALSGDAIRGLVLLERALDQTVAFGVLGGRSLLLAWLAEARLLAGRGADAWEAAEEAVTLATRHNELGHLAWALWSRAIVRARGNDPEEAACGYGEACTLAGQLEMRPLVAHCRFGLGTVYAGLGQRERAGIEFGAAAELFAAMEMNPGRGRAAGAGL